MALGSAQQFAPLVKAAITSALTSGAAAPSFRGRLEKVLQQRPHPLHADSPLRPAHLALGAYRVAGGKGEGGIPAAAAMEVMISASHVLDAVADGDRHTDPSDGQAGPALIFLASRLLESARRPDGASVDWSPVYAKLLHASGGQQRDVELQAEAGATLHDAKAMTEAKSGSIGEAIALAGGLSAGAGGEVLSRIGLFGRLAATRSQLIDDATDASTRAPGTSDITLRKKTVPIAYFLHTRGDDVQRDHIRDLFLAGGISKTDELEIRRAIEASGAIELTLTLAHWYRMKAESLLEQLELNSCPTQLLRFMLEEPQASQPPALSFAPSLSRPSAG